MVGWSLSYSTSLALHLFVVSVGHVIPSPLSHCHRARLSGVLSGFRLGCPGLDGTSCRLPVVEEDIKAGLKKWSGPAEA